MGCSCSTAKTTALAPQTQASAAAALEGEGPALLNVVSAAELHTWDGWGTTLCWWATALGHSERLADLFFTTEEVEVHGRILPGLGLNIARYCIGGSSSKQDHTTGRGMKVSPLSPRYKQTQGFLVSSGSSSSMEDQSSERWDWGADENQVRMLQMAKARGVNFMEAFSNSPMWWMTKNHSTMGGRGAHNNLKDDYFDDFAKYLAITIQHFKEHKGIEFTSISPFNEPIFCYNVLMFPQPQERCGFDANLQAWILGHLYHELQERGLSSVALTASDETSAKHAANTWDKLNSASLPHKHGLHGKRPQELVRKWNVHGYKEPSDDELKHVHQARCNTPRPPVLWMSEYGDDDATGSTLAKEIHRHMRCMKPTGWCLWQVVDPEWGLLMCDLENSTHVHTICQKYYVFAHFTRHIRPGMTILSVSGSHTVAAYDARHHVLAIVATNLSKHARTLTYDLSDFAVHGSITRWCTNFEGHDRYRKYQYARLTGAKLEVEFPARTIMSIQLEDAHLSTISI